jgi:hypothetical protein
LTAKEPRALDRNPPSLPARGEGRWGKKEARLNPPESNLDQTRSEEEVALVSFAFCPAVSAEAHLLGIVSAEFVAKELPVWSAPRLQLSVHDWQTFPAKRAASCCIRVSEAFIHLLSLTPDQKRYPRRSVAYQSPSPLTVAKTTHI